MTEPRRTVALLGLPRTGKSTYLGALWQLIQDSAEPAIVERDVRGDRSYLQALGEQVAQAEEIQRTEVESNEGLELTVGFNDDGDVHLTVPDLSGETLRQLVEDRYWHPQLLEVLETASALLVFVHPSRLELPISIEVADELLGPAGPDGGDAPVFDVRLASTVAKHLDAFENVLNVLRPSWPIRVGLVVSAYDTVDPERSPSEWLADRLTGLNAFLQSNHDMVIPAVFGVSAQGGRLPEQQDALLDRGDVRERVFGIDSAGVRVSLAEPIRWAVWG